MAVSIACAVAALSRLKPYVSLAVPGRDTRPIPVAGNFLVVPNVLYLSARDETYSSTLSSLNAKSVPFVVIQSLNVSTVKVSVAPVKSIVISTPLNFSIVATNALSSSLSA